jgi:GT2 family glycosyltransferase
MGYKATAIVVNWNSYAYLNRCIKALKSQTVPFDKIVVVDNASDELLPDIIINIKKEVEFIQSPINHGFAKGNNLAIKNLDNCDFVALVNPDAYLEPDWLAKMLAAAERHPDMASFATCLVMSNNPDCWDGIGDRYNISGLVWRDGHAWKRELYAVDEREVFSACAAAALYRHKLLMQVEGFDEDYFCYVEDVDLGFRLRLFGYPCVLVPDAIAHHEGSVTTGGKHSDFAVYHGHRNLVWTFVKNMPSLLFWVLLPLHLIMNLLSIIVFALRGQGLVVLRAKWDAIKGLGLIWQKRKQIQSKRVASVRTIWRALDKRVFPLR